MDKGPSASRTERHGKETDHEHPLPNIRMGGTLPPLDHMTSECVKDKFTFTQGPVISRGLGWRSG